VSLTQSEQLFETFCQTKRIRYARIPAGNSRTPDYEIFVPRRKVIVEIKEISPNSDELDAQRRAVAGEFVVVKSKPGKRVRGKIGDAVPQIKMRARGRLSGLLVLMDTGFVSEHTSPYNIRVAMHGFETLVYAVPSDRSQLPYVADRKFGGGRKMTCNSNTSVSAIAVISRINRNLDFRVYHNSHAAIPLQPAVFARYQVPQYTLAPHAPGSIPDWAQV
jgi:hypothetical protein